MKQTGTENTSWQGEPALRFCAGGYEALIIPGIGANVTELKNKGLKADILRSPDDIETFRNRPQVYGIPVLFPPNRIEDGTFKAGGKVYNFPVNEPNSNHNHIHGFLRQAAWTIASAGTTAEDTVEVEAVFNCDRDTDFYRYFQHEFEIKMLYRLNKDGLFQKFAVTNLSSSPMPMGLGFHTAFRTPFIAGGSADDCKVYIAAGDRWELGERMLPSGNMLPQDKEEDDFRKRGVKPQGHRISAHYRAQPLDFKGRRFNGAIIEDCGTGFRLVYEAGEGYKHWMVWNDTADKGFICPEPQTWAVNAPNLKLPEEVTGFMMLEPGHKWEDTCRIYVERM